jgi:hypothetical protein
VWLLLAKKPLRKEVVTKPEYLKRQFSLNQPRLLDSSTSQPKKRHFKLRNINPFKAFPIFARNDPTMAHKAGFVNIIGNPNVESTWRTPL